MLNSEPLEQVEYIIEMAEFMVLQEFSEEDYSDQLSLAVDILNINLGLDPLGDADDDKSRVSGHSRHSGSQGGKSQGKMSQGGKSNPSASGTSVSKGTKSSAASDKGTKKAPYRISHLEMLARIYGLRAKVATSFRDVSSSMLVCSHYYAKVIEHALASAKFTGDVPSMPLDWLGFVVAPEVAKAWAEDKVGNGISRRSFPNVELLLAYAEFALQTMRANMQEIHCIPVIVFLRLLAQFVLDDKGLVSLCVPLRIATEVCIIETLRRYNIIEAQVAGKLGLKDASAKALAAAGSFKFDDTSQRLFDDILMQRRQLNDASKSLNSARSKVSKAKEPDSPVLQAQTLKRLMAHQTWLKQVPAALILLNASFKLIVQCRRASSLNSENWEMPNSYCCNANYTLRRLRTKHRWPIVCMNSLCCPSSREMFRMQLRWRVERSSSSRTWSSGRGVFPH